MDGEIKLSLFTHALFSSPSLSLSSVAIFRSTMASSGQSILSSSFPFVTKVFLQPSEQNSVLIYFHSSFRFHLHSPSPPIHQPFLQHYPHRLTCRRETSSS